jgi:hypothetical protein
MEGKAMQNDNYRWGDQPLGSGHLDLKQFEEDFAQAEIDDQRFEAIPDGKYQVNVERVDLTRAQASGYPMLKWTLRILAPRFRGRLLWRNNVIATRENIRWLKQDLHTCGLDLERLSELPNRLDDLLDVKVEVTKRARGENENVYFNRRVVLEDGPSDYNAGPQDDCPF